jgi:hypothetical protein
MNSIIKRLTLAAAVLTVAAMFVLPAATVNGDDTNLKTYISVSHAFQVPGAVLQPNTKYVLRRLDANAGTNHVVRILNEDQSEVISTFFAVSDYRLEPSDETVLTFIETAPGYPKPVRSWFYPGRVNGLEFIYSKADKAEFAAHAPGMESTTIQAAQMTTTEETVVAPEPVAAVETQVQIEEPVAQITEKEVEPIVEQPSTVLDQTANAEPQPAPVMDDSANSVNTERELPRTAGELPLIGLLGFAALGLRQVLRKF